MIMKAYTSQLLLVNNQWFFHLLSSIVVWIMAQKAAISSLISWLRQKGGGGGEQVSAWSERCLIKGPRAVRNHWDLGTQLLFSEHLAFDLCIVYMEHSIYVKRMSESSLATGKGQSYQFRWPSNFGNLIIWQGGAEGWWRHSMKKNSGKPLRNHFHKHPALDSSWWGLFSPTPEKRSKQEPRPGSMRNASPLS